MYILDTDHVTILQRGGKSAQILNFRLSSVKSSDIFTTIITYEEQTRGWLAHLAKLNSLSEQISGYQELEKHLKYYSYIPILSFDKDSANEFKRLRKISKKLGTMDLKIASIAITNQATLLTRNLSDFGQIKELKAEDWSRE